MKFNYLIITLLFVLFPAYTLNLKEQFISPDYCNDIADYYKDFSLPNPFANAVNITIDLFH